MFLQLQVWAFMLLQDQPVISFDPRSMWENMSWPARLVVIILFLMSAWSIGVMIDRL
jgi:biopolymer transport protein ExbB